MHYGIKLFGPQLWKGWEPELAVAGPNKGSNLAHQVPWSGTVGAARFAVYNMKLPAIAFSGDDKVGGRWDEPTETSLMYAKLSTFITQEIIDSGVPYLPDGVFLNVNLPDVEDCWDISDYKFVLSRINEAYFWSKDDLDWCGSNTLPWEVTVADRKCHVSISPGDGYSWWKTTENNITKQEIVRDKLRGILSCLE